MPGLLLASGNEGKLREFEAILEDLEVNLITPRQLGIELDVPEEGSTYEENAARKALAYARITGLVTLADDTGLEVEALDGLPGLYSKRFAPIPDASDADRRAYLLERLRSHTRPWTARFHCTVALATPGGVVRFAQGECSGEVIPEERGQEGFGYDSIFLITELEKTMAELTLEEKNQVSHRSRAVKKAVPILLEILSSSP